MVVRLRLFRTGLAALALLAARPALAVSLTGNVEADFQAADKSVRIIPDRINDVSQPSWMTDQGLSNGWNMKDLRTSYNAASDTLFVGVNFLGVAGDVDGNGDPGTTSPMALSSHGLDVAHLGGRESITVAIDPTFSGTPSLIAGVPADKANAGTGIDGFNITAYKPSNQGIQFSYGETLANHMGALAFDPSAAHPDFEFTIRNFSKLPGLDPTKGFQIGAYAGSPDDVIVGEDHIALTPVVYTSPQIPGPPIVTPPQTPEPTTILSWGLVMGGLSWRLRRRRASA